MFQQGLAILPALLWCAGASPEAVQQEQYLVPPTNLPQAPYAEWAHYHWVWLSNDRANQSSMTHYTADYLNRGIKVGAVDIDSGWSTGFNNFIFDTKKYPNATEMIEHFHSKNIRVLLWATSMIDSTSSNYQQAYDKGYLIRNALGKQALLKWWHGDGGMLDYSNPEAVSWWHTQMDKVLDMGIDGWKCDGTDPFIVKLGIATGKDGDIVSRRMYSDSYYGDFFDYTRERLGKDRLIMSRPVDGDSELGVYLDFSPRRVVYSGWVGDQDPDYHGLENALKRYLQSAWAGYANFGSDIGGYRSGNDTPLGRTKQLLVRWTQLGAFSPLMENGGNKEHRPLKFDENNETLNIYSKFVNAHYQLVPYLLTTGSEAFEGDNSSITPLAPHQNFIEKVIDDFNPSTYNYLLGKDILVAPIFSNSSSVAVTFPDKRPWVYWWDHGRVYSNGSAALSSVPLEEYPVFFPQSTFIPLRVSDQATALPKSPTSRCYVGVDLWVEFTGYLRWLLHLPSSPPRPVMAGGGVASRQVREESGGGIMASYRWYSEACLSVNITAHPVIKSLLHLAGLPRPLTSIHVRIPRGDWKEVTDGKVRTYSELKRLAFGGYVQLHHADMYHVLVHPPEFHGPFGHCLRICF